MATAAQALEYDNPQRQVNLSFWNLDPGDTCVLGEYNVDVDATVNGVFQRIKLWDGDWSVTGQPVPIGGGMSFDVPGATTSTNISIDVWDRHNWPCPDYHLFTYSSTYDLSSALPVNVTWPQTDGWGLSATISTRIRRPKICAEWPVQYLDSGYGEDKLPGTTHTFVPASFAEVRLKITGGKAQFVEKDAILDKDGCLSVDDAPTAEQLEAADPSFDVSLTWLGKLSVPIEGKTEKLQVFVEETKNGDSWDECGCQGQRFTDPVGVAGCPTNTCFYGRKTMPPMVLVASEGTENPTWRADSPQKMMFRFGSTGPDFYPTEYSNTGGLVSQLLQYHMEEKVEMGLVSGTVHIWPKSPDAFLGGSPGMTPDGDNKNRYIGLRPEWYTLNADGTKTTHESDAHRKFVVAHEFGHTMQAMGSGDSGGNYYNLKVQDAATGQWDYILDPPSFPPECRCTHVGKEFQPDHCMNSLEMVGAAFGEGFGHYYAARLWNNPAESNADCWVPYAKWALLPACPSSPSGHSVECLRVGAPDNKDPDEKKNAYLLINNLYHDQTDRDHLRKDLSNWYFVKGPALISCADATRWRNKYCNGDRPGTSTVATEPDISELGNEMDWMQLYWALTRDTNAWRIPQYFALQRAACGGRLCKKTDDHSLHAWKKYEEMRANPTGELVAPSGHEISFNQWQKLGDEGYNRGVSLDLTNK